MYPGPQEPKIQLHRNSSEIKVKWSLRADLFVRRAAWVTSYASDDGPQKSANEVAPGGKRESNSPKFRKRFVVHGTMRLKAKRPTPQHQYFSESCQLHSDKDPSFPPRPYVPLQTKPQEQGSSPSSTAAPVPWRFPLTLEHCNDNTAGSLFSNIPNRWDV